MIVTSSLHNHTLLCDGAASPEAMAEAAYAAGFTDFGFSGHSSTPFAPEGALADERAYIDRIRAVRARFAGRLRVYVGTEADALSRLRYRDEYDYVIGSVHFLPGEEGDYAPIDTSVADSIACRDRLFGGDGMAMAEAYYRLLTRHVLDVKADIVGHFDIVAKYNMSGALFDETSSRYLGAAQAAVTQLAGRAIFEVNTRGQLRGYKTDPYPRPELLAMICAAGGDIILSADSHDVTSLDYGFDAAAALLRQIGFSALTVWEDGRFVKKSL